MALIELDGPNDAKAYVGRPLPPSDWVTVDQATIDAFADATGDHQWIHVDRERAARDMPGGKTIAHGYLMLSLIPRLSSQIIDFKRLGRSINYGCNRIRFTHPVPAGSRVRLRMTYAAADEVKGGGVRLVQDCVVEIEGADRPALVAQTIRLVHP